MNRRQLLQRTTMFGLVSTIPFSRAVAERTHLAPADANPLKPPTQGSIPVAFVISEGAVIIDFCGPWEVFENVNVPDREGNPFRLYTVGPSSAPIHASSGMKIIPDYTFENAPAPKVIVIPAQNGSNDAMLNWVRKASKTTDVTMSVCTGAFILAHTGLLDGKAATTHHGAFKTFATQFPDIQLKRGARFVEEGNLASAGGLSSGIDLALRVVELFRSRRGHSNRVPNGISGSRLVERWLKRSVCQSADLNRRASVVPGMRHGSRSQKLPEVGLPGQDLLLLHGVAQSRFRRGPQEILGQ